MGTLANASFLQVQAPSGDKTTSIWGLVKGGALRYRTGVTATNPAGEKWETVDGTVTRLFPGKKGVLYASGKMGEKVMLFVRDGIDAKKNPKGTTWKSTWLVNLTSVAVGGSESSLALWGINSNKEVLFSNEILGGDTSKWKSVNGTTMKSLSVSPDGTSVWGVTSNGDVVVRKRITPLNPAGDEWVVVPGPAPATAGGSLTPAAKFADLRDNSVDTSTSATDVDATVRQFVIQVACADASKAMFKFPSWICDKCQAGMDDTCLNYEAHTEMFSNWFGNCIAAANSPEIGCSLGKEFTAEGMAQALTECRMTESMRNGASGKDVIRNNNVLAIKRFMSKGPTASGAMDCSCPIARTCAKFDPSKDAVKLNTVKKRLRTSGADTTTPFTHPAGTAGKVPLRGIASVTVSNGGNVWAVSDVNEVLFRDDVTTALPQGVKWTKLEGKLKQVAAGVDGDVWAVGTSGTAFYRAGITTDKPRGSEWTKAKSDIPIEAVFPGPQTDLEVPKVAPPGEANPPGEIRAANAKFCVDFGIDRAQTFDCTKTDFQKYYTVPVEVEGASDKKYFRIKSVKPDRCMTLQEQSISMVKCAASRDDQLWLFAKPFDPSAKYELKNIKSKSQPTMCVDTKGSDADTKGIELVMNPCAPMTRSQSWFVPGQTIDPVTVKTSVPVKDLFQEHNTELIGFDYKYDEEYGAGVCPGEFVYDKCMGSHCPDYTDCASCAQDHQCGWCGMENGAGHCVRGGAAGPRGGQCCVDATGKLKSSRMCDNPENDPKPYPSDAAQCLVCLDRDRNFFREAGGFWAHKPEEWRTLRPGKLLPDFVLQRVCRMNNTLPNESKVPVMRIPEPRDPNDKRDALTFARDTRRDEVRQRQSSKGIGRR